MSCVPELIQAIRTLLPVGGVADSAGSTPPVEGGWPEDLLRLIDFNGLTNGQSVVSTANDPGSVEGKRFDFVLGNIGFSGGYGVQASTAVKAPGKTSSCLVSIANGSDGDPSGGDTGTGMGAWGGGVQFGADELSEGEEMWYGQRIYLAPGYSWDNGTGTSQTGYIKFGRFDNSENGQRIDHHIISGKFDDNAAADNLQIGWTLANEFDPKAQNETHKLTQAIITPGEWHWVEFYVKAHSDPAQAVRRIWMDNVMVFERVGATNRWIDQNGDAQTQVLSVGEQSLPSTLATLTGYLHGTYWNGYSPQDNVYYLQEIAYHKNGESLIATDQFGNKMLGAPV